MQEQCYWTAQFPSVNFPPPLHLPEKCEVAIIGGGLTGLSTALHLANAGVSVLLFEQETLGWGASTRNAGMALTGLKLSPELLVQKYGLAHARRLFQSSLEALSGLEDLLAQEKIDCDFRRRGDLCAAYKPAHFKGLQATQDFLQKHFQHETHLLPAAELQRELSSPLYHGGLSDPKSAGLNPAKLVAGLATAARRAGALLFEKTPVQACHRREAGFLLDTPRGRLRCKEVLVATNAYTPDYFSGLRRRIIPVGSYVVATEELGEARARELLPANRMVFDTKNFLFYFRRTPDERLLFGGRTSFTPKHALAAAQILRCDLLRVFPQLASCKIAFAWHGSVGFTFDQMPHCGVLEGVHYALGYAGHGVVMSVHFGKCLAQILTGVSCDSPFLRLRLPSRIFYRRRPWFLPLAGAYYGVRDRL